MSYMDQRVVRFADSRPGGVTRLPPEILTRIFHLVADGYTSWSHPENWTTVTHVCRFWRAAALNDPSLWTYVSERLPRPWMDEYLQRSDPLPVRLNYSLMSREAVQDHVSAIILESTHRLGELVIDQRRGSDIFSRIDRPAPALTQLMVLSNEHSRIPQQIFGGHSPPLCKLVLSSVVMPLRAPWLQNVRDLELEGDYSFYDEAGTSVPVSVDSVLNLLASLPHLERLSLEARVSNFSHMPASDNLHLAHLKTAEIYIDEHCIPLVDIFSHISAVTPIGLILSLELDSVDYFRIQAACRFFLESISQTPSKFVWDDAWIAAVSYPPAPAIADEINFIIERSQRGELFAVLANHLLPYVEIRTLRVDSPHPGWLFFSDSQSVDRLEIAAFEPFQILLSTSTTSFPSLRHLHIRNFDISDCIPMLMPWLVRRHSAGVDLADLTLSSVGPVEDQDLESLGRYATVNVHSGP